MYRNNKHLLRKNRIDIKKGSENQWIPGKLYLTIIFPRLSSLVPLYKPIFNSRFRNSLFILEKKASYVHTCPGI